MSEVAIVLGLSDTQRAAAAALLLEAFSAKLGPLAGRGPSGERVIAASLRGESCLTATERDRLVGVCGIGRRDADVLQVRLKTLVREFGWLMALPRWLALALGRRIVPGSMVRIEYLAVAPDARGRGIGTRLMAAAAELARREGCCVVLLDVVDTNPRARALYERLGYRSVRTQRVPWPSRWLGFGAVTQMALTLGG